MLSTLSLLFVLYITASKTILVQVDALKLQSFYIEVGRPIRRGEGVGCALSRRPGVGAAGIDAVAPPIIGGAYCERRLDRVRGLCARGVRRACLGVLTAPAGLATCLVEGLAVCGHP